jgi:hypothetical protein
MSDYALTTTPPEFVPELPRSYKDAEGTVIKEAGVVQTHSDGKQYWKAFQLIEKSDGTEEIRSGYYTKNGWQNKPLMLPPEIMSDLTTFAAGKIW